MDKPDVGDPMPDVADALRIIAAQLGVEPTGPEMQNLAGLNARTISGVLEGTRSLGEGRRRHILVTARLLLGLADVDH